MPDILKSSSGEVIDHSDLVTAPYECFRQMRTNEAGSTGYQCAIQCWLYFPFS
jgi:hypothetical protein